jgi:hypothetical protein
MRYTLSHLVGLGEFFRKKTSGTNVMILKIFSPKNLAKMFAFFAQTIVSFCKNCDHNIGFREKRQIFSRKLAKIAEICDHNIEPWTGHLEFRLPINDDATKR